MAQQESVVEHMVRLIGDALGNGGLETDLRSVFEQGLQRALGALAVRLGDPSPGREGPEFIAARQGGARPLRVPVAFARGTTSLDIVLPSDGASAVPDSGVLANLSTLAGLVADATIRRPPPAASSARADSSFDALVGASGTMQAVRERIERVAQTDFTVLIEGESGTGKELVARQIHARSRRRTGPFVAVNCAALVETLLEAELFGIEDRTATGVRGRRGKFEHADGGTLFLDEISDLSLSAQAKLLRAIQDVAVERVGGNGTRRVNTRIVAATNRSLADMAAHGHFRTDLYYRLGGVEIHVPPLRVRRDDIIELTTHFLERHGQTRQLRFSDAALDALRMYQWPGNVRELERLVERAVALTEAPVIELDDLPPQLRADYAEVIGPSISAGDSLRAWGSRYARLVFERCGRNKRRTCRFLDISYHTLEAYLRYPQLDPTDRSQLPAWARSVSAPPALQEAGE